ncbi:MAG TPA: hypothetical protein VL495_08815 [Edaphobacter sp.]|jgi:hypothetical protein|nr:hypothetical protein [Edaphobacter sp.]
MKKLSVTELRKTIKAAEAERLKIQQPFKPEDPKLQRSQHASETLISKWMSGSGLNLDKLQTLHKKRDAELQRIAAKHKRETQRLVPRTKNKLEIAVQGKALAELAARQDFFPNPSFNLDTPFLIWSTPLLSVDSSAAPFSSWAKFRFLTSDSLGIQKVSFYFYWNNPYSDYAVISAYTYLSAAGYLRAHAPWSVLVNTSTVRAWAWFGLWFGVSKDLNPANYVTNYLGVAGAYGSLVTGPDVSSSTVSAGTGLSYPMFAVPPGNVAVFEVALAVEYNNSGGNIEADFANGNFQIACPVVVFSLLNSPAGKSSNLG